MSDEIISKSFIVVASAVAGAGLLFFIKLDHKKLCSLISFSAGALMAAALFVLLPESYQSITIIELGASALSGYLLFFFISKYYSHVCPACAASHFDEMSTHKFSEIVLTLLTALSIHSFLDGVAISSGNINSQIRDESIFAAIAVHKFPEGLALAALMFSANYKRIKILLYVILVEMITVLGAAAGMLFLKNNISQLIMGIVMAHIAGGFIFLAVHAVLGEMFKNHKQLVAFSFASGLILILAIHFIT
ncbi:MAG TPA: ZIP family metal transporter [Ignavibacteriaceae bacterium]|nr:ZIP family metal transporter [Ignavibacteriaceae bacterium]